MVVQGASLCCMMPQRFSIILSYSYILMERGTTTEHVFQEQRSGVARQSLKDGDYIFVYNSTR